MATLAETLGIYRDMMALNELLQPLQPLKPGQPAVAAANDAAAVATNASGQVTKAQQDLSAAKEEVPALPSDRTPEDQAKLDKAKAEIVALPLSTVTAESHRSGIFAALMGEALEEPERDYQEHVMSSLHGWFKRNMPTAHKMLWLTGKDKPEQGNRLYGQILLPRIVKWDFPHHFSREYQDMIRDLLITMQQHKP